jgi:glycosyltransferase involved in cell wall biosynthesis
MDRSGSSESMIPVTVIIPVKNEEKNLSRNLNSVRGFSDVVVVDSGSTDGTVKLANECGCNVVTFKWDGKFPKKRNWILRNYPISTEWVLFLDADECISDAFKTAVILAIQDESKSGYWLRYNNYFQGKLLKHGIPFKKLALFKWRKGEYEKIEEERWSNLDMEIHEHPIISGEIGEIKEPIIHYDYKGFHNYLSKHNEYSSWEAHRYLKLKEEGNSLSLTPRQKKKYKHLENIWWAPLYFITQYFLRGGFLDGKEGFTFSLLKAIYFFEIRCKIKELNR